jgi:SRSO17 transposase|tara:strand:+ start:563 stop:859 length:297 start_codon:yes stop_codon:yes gene_type:complete
MTYLYYNSTSTAYASKPNDKEIGQWKHMADKGHWRITQLPNGFYQTEVSNPEEGEKWHSVTRRESLDGAESAIDGSIEYFAKKLDTISGPKVVKTFKK